MEENTECIVRLIHRYVYIGMCMCVHTHTYNIYFTTSLNLKDKKVSKR